VIQNNHVQNSHLRNPLLSAFICGSNIFASAFFRGSNPRKSAGFVIPASEARRESQSSIP